MQIPCLERNAVASIKAITAAGLALRGDRVLSGSSAVSGSGSARIGRGAGEEAR